MHWFNLYITQLDSRLTEKNDAAEPELPFFIQCTPSLSEPGTYITHNATQPLAVCKSRSVMLIAANVAWSSWSHAEMRGDYRGLLSLLSFQLHTPRRVFDISKLVVFNPSEQATPAISLWCESSVGFPSKNPLNCMKNATSESHKQVTFSQLIKCYCNFLKGRRLYLILETRWYRSSVFVALS